MKLNRLIAPLLSLIVLAGVGIAIYFSVQDSALTRRTVTLKGFIGSEKEAFFEDEQVQEVLASNGIIVEIEKAGSRQISTLLVTEEWDFAFPAGVPAAEKIKEEHATGGTYRPFFTPMVIATYTDIAKILEEEEQIAADQGGYYTVDMNKLVNEYMVPEARWTEVDEGAGLFSVDQDILIKSTDIRKSNSAAMYLSLVSYVYNGNQIVPTPNDGSVLMADDRNGNGDSDIAGVFLRQGLPPFSSSIPFEDYITKGMGHSPMVMIYEAQFIEHLAQNNGSITDQMVLMYPEPTIFTRHTYIAAPDNEGAELLGELLESDPDLIKLAIEYGLRNSDVGYFQQFTTDTFAQYPNVSMPNQIINVIEPPSFETLEEMICIIQPQYDANDRCDNNP